MNIQGSVHGGQQPIKGAHVYLFAANTTGYGQPSVSTLDSSASGVATDAVGAYVTTDDSGSFSITGAYSCTPGTQLYLYGLGGNPGFGINTGSGLMAILGECPASGSFLSSIPFITINEVSTVAAAYSMAGFATDATHVSSSGTALAKTGIANAFATAAKLANISTGAIQSTSSLQTNSLEINTVADILAACINSTGAASMPCTVLFSNARSGGSTGTVPTDTATTAINIAHNPSSNVTTLYGLIPATVPFQPIWTNAPTNLTVSVKHGIPGAPAAVAVDSSGNVWATGFSLNSVTKLSNAGVVLSQTALPVQALPSSKGLVIDQDDNAWIASRFDTTIFRISSSGTLSTYTLADQSSNSSCEALAVDGSGNIWCAWSDRSLSGSGTLKKLSPSGVDLNFPNISTVGNFGLSLDLSGNAWTTNLNHDVYVTSTSTSQNVYTTHIASGDSFAVDAAGSIWSGGSPTTRFSYDPATQAYSATTLPGNGGSIVVDGAGSLWTINTYSVFHFAGDGSPLTPNGFSASGRFGGGLALDSSGNIWVGNIDAGPLTEIVGVATPVITPISLALKNGTPGSRP